MHGTVCASFVLQRRPDHRCLLEHIQYLNACTMLGLAKQLGSAPACAHVLNHVSGQLSFVSPTPTLLLACKTQVFSCSYPCRCTSSRQMMPVPSALALQASS